MSKKSRGKRGSAIAEFGPSLLLLLVLTLFPMINLLYLGGAYSMAWVGHRNALREFSVHAPNATGQAQARNKATTEFQNTGMAAFLGLGPGNMNHVPTYLPDATNPETVRVTTTANIRSFFFLPYGILRTIPGLGSPLAVRFVTERPQEEKGRN